MRKNPGRIFIGLLIVLLVFFLFPVKSASLSCAGTVMPGVVTANTTKSFTFSLQNTGTLPITKIKIIRPSSNFSIKSYPDSDRTVFSLNENDILVGGNNLANGQATSLALRVLTGPNETAPAAWIIEVFNESGGTTVNSRCSGAITTEVKGNVRAPVISNITVTDITIDSVIVRWNTDIEALDTLDYGKTVSYGQQVRQDAGRTVHFMQLNRLEPNSTYHYRIASSAGGLTTSSNDNTFVTQKPDPVPPVVTVPPNPQVNPTAKALTTPKPTPIPSSIPQASPSPTPVVETDAPTITFDFDFSKKFTSPPVINGIAQDATGILKVDFSFDNGHNWLPIETSDYKDPKRVVFSFTPDTVDDGNYNIKVRAYDLIGNIGISETKTLIIDQVPPAIGTFLAATGAQILEPDAKGTITTQVGLDQSITLSVIGGATSVDINAKDKVFSLVQNKSNGLWKGTLSFSEPGSYELIANAVDGGNNKTERKLSTIKVLDSGKVTSDGKSLREASITVFTYIEDEKRFVVWDGSSLAQNNPQKSDDRGRYSLILPTGKYYIEITARGYKKARTDIFSVSGNMPVTDAFKLEKSSKFLSSFKDRFWPTRVGITSNVRSTEVTNNTEFWGKEFPVVTLHEGDKEVSTKPVSGQWTVFTFVNTWSPQSNDQLQYLLSVQQSIGARIVVIVSQESSSSVEVFKRRGNYSLIVVSDPDGSLTRAVGVKTTPTTFFVNTDGLIINNTFGVLNGEQIRHVLSYGAY